MHTRGWFRAVSAAALIALASLSMAACGDDDDDADEASPTATAGEEEPEGEATVTIEMKDYAFVVSGALVEGGSIEFTNTGKELHMTGFGKLKSGKTIEDVTDVLERQSGGGGGGGGGEGEGEGGEDGTDENAAAARVEIDGRASRSEHGTTTTRPGGGGEDGEGGEEEDPFADILDEVSLPGNFAIPGTAATVGADTLDVGNYALLCFIPVEGGGPPHFARGMVGELEVVEGEAPEPPTPAGTYQLDKTGKFTGPTTLTAGEQTIAIEVGADAEQQEPGLARPKGNTTFDALDKHLEQLDESEEIPAGFGVGIPAEFLLGLFDVEDAETIYLTVDFEPGTYYLASEDTDDEEESYPPPLRITVR